VPGPVPGFEAPIKDRRDFLKGRLGAVGGSPQAGLDPHRGFALASMRKPMLSRYYIQCDLWLEK
jgi:hypothetical protein